MYVTGKGTGFGRSAREDAVVRNKNTAGGSVRSTTP